MADESTTPRGYGEILVPFDGSGGSIKALERALALAGQFQARVTTVTVDEHSRRYAPGVGEIEEDDDVQRAFFDDLRSRATTIAREAGGEIVMVTRAGNAARTIVDYAAEGGFQLIAIGHTGHSGVWGQLLGSTTARVVDQAKCDVLVVR